MLADQQARDADADLFGQRWNEWTVAGKPFPLPAGWRASIQRFVAAGLPMPVLVACLEKAMGTSKIRHDDVFRYTCGIAWKKVTELHDAARATVGDRVADQSGCSADCDWTCCGSHDDPVRRGRLLLAESILAEAMDAYPGLVDEVVGTGRSDQERDLEDRWYPDEPEPLVASSRILVAYLVGELLQYESLARQYLRSLSPDDQAWCEDEVLADYAKAEMAMPQPYEHARHLLRLAFRLSERMEADL
jgi:hypothetical protein